MDLTVWIRWASTRNAGLAVLGGLVAAMAYPNPLVTSLHWSGGVLAFFCLIPLLAIREDRGVRFSGLWGFIYGMVFFGVLLVWVAQMPALQPFGLLAWLVLTAYLALYPAFFLVLYHAGIKRGLPFWVLASLLWVAGEYFRNYFLSGFSWGALGSAHFQNDLMLLLAPVVGLWGLSWVTVLVNCGLYAIGKQWWPWLAGKEQGTASLQPDGFWRWIALLVILTGVGTGALSERWKMQHPVEGGESVRVAALQGNINQNQSWDLQYQDETLRVFRELIQRAARVGSELVVWPETAFPGVVSQNPRLAGELQVWSKEWRLTQVVGSDEVEKKGEEYDYYNAAWLLDDQGRWRGLTTKNHLVPLGEYVPLKDSLLFFIHKIVRRYGGAGFTPGTQRTLLEWPRADKKIPMGVLICFESVFPQHAVELTRRGAQLLIVMTYDTWFGQSAAPAQHALMSAIRAAENGRYLVRVAASGISGIFDPHGRLLSSLPLDTRGILAETVTPRAPLTLYTRWGDWIVGVCLLWLILECLALLGIKKRPIPDAQR